MLLMVRLLSDADINSRKLALSLAEMSSRPDEVKLSPQLSILRSELGLLRDSLVIGLSDAGLTSFSADLETNSAIGDGDGSCVLAGVKGLEFGSNVDWKVPAMPF